MLFRSPLAFARMDSKTQFNTLARFIPDVDFEEIEAQNKADYQRRTDLNRKAKESRTLADSIVIPAGIPDKTIDESLLIDELGKAAKHNADIDSRKQNRTRLKFDIDSKRKEIERLTEEIVRLQTRQKELTDEADSDQNKLDSAPPLPEPIDIQKLRDEINKAKSINASIRSKDEKLAYEDAAKDLETQAQLLTSAMEKREADKRAKIASSKLPVSSIVFGEGELLMNGVPFSQASDAEQLRASIAIAMAANTKLRVIRVRDGSLLDSTSMKILSEMAEKNDCQVWVETVRSDGRMGFILEDGHLKTETETVIEGDEL